MAVSRENWANPVFLATLNHFGKNHTLKLAGQVTTIDGQTSLQDAPISAQKAKNNHSLNRKCWNWFMNVISCHRTKPSKEQDEDGQVMIIKQPKIARCIWQMVFQANFGLGLWRPILSVQIKNGFKIHKNWKLCTPT